MEYEVQLKKNSSFVFMCVYTHTFSGVNFVQYFNNLYIKQSFIDTYEVRY